MVKELLLKVLVGIMIAFAPFMYFDAVLLELNRFGLNTYTTTKIVAIVIGLFAAYLIYQGAVKIGIYKGNLYK